MPLGLTEVLGVVPLEVFANAFNYMVLLESAPVVRALSPDLAVITRLDRSGVIVTAPPSSHTSPIAVGGRPRASKHRARSFANLVVRRVTHPLFGLLRW